MNKDSQLIWEAYGNDPFDRFTEADPHNSTEWRKIRELLDKGSTPLVKLETPEGDKWITAAGFGQGKGKGWPSDPGDDDLSIYGYLKGGKDININISDLTIKIIDVVV